MFPPLFSPNKILSSFSVRSKVVPKSLIIFYEKINFSSISKLVAIFNCCVIMQIISIDPGVVFVSVGNNEKVLERFPYAVMAVIFIMINRLKLR